LKPPPRVTVLRQATRLVYRVQFGPPNASAANAYYLHTNEIFGVKCCCRRAVPA